MTLWRDSLLALHPAVLGRRRKKTLNRFFAPPYLKPRLTSATEPGQKSGLLIIQIKKSSLIALQNFTIRPLLITMAPLIDLAWPGKLKNANNRPFHNGHSMPRHAVVFV
ncbi:hypothetical protein [Pseudogulbenkiania subflava]|uniref:hypothetical protein n=1 Tax=Pseudogulbenkiania subflava TaxID=451637 RepID=UPI00117A82CF|nr:hypothetical protein [Pseudogulbenkiania subflava]